MRARADAACVRGDFFEERGSGWSECRKGGRAEAKGVWAGCADAPPSAFAKAACKLSLLIPKELLLFSRATAHSYSRGCSQNCKATSGSIGSLTSKLRPAIVVSRTKVAYFGSSDRRSYRKAQSRRSLHPLISLTMHSIRSNTLEAWAYMPNVESETSMVPLSQPALRRSRRVTTTYTVVFLRASLKRSRVDRVVVHGRR